MSSDIDGEREAVAVTIRTPSGIALPTQNSTESQTIAPKKRQRRNVFIESL
jgi:hypothetical protein